MSYDRHNALQAAQNWIKKAQEYAAGQYRLSNLAARGIDLDATLRGLTVKELRVLCHCMSAAYSTGHEDNRQFKIDREHREASNKAQAIQLAADRPANVVLFAKAFA